MTHKNSDKSYVTVEQHQCPVCGVIEDSGAILMDRGLRDRFEHHTLTGYGLCKEHQAQFDDGYIFLVAADPDESLLNMNGTVSIDEAHRTGEIAAVRRNVAKQMFNRPIPTNGVMFCDPEVIEQLKEMVDGT